MDKITFPTIDFSEINAYTNKRDLELWKRQAVGKYSKIKYEEFHKRNEILDKEIEKCEQKIKKVEDKIPKVKALVERVANSITIASVAIDHLIARKIEVANEITSVKERYEKMIAEYLSAYEDERKILEQRSVLYRELDETSNTVERLNIERNILRQSVEDYKKMINVKVEINRKLINSNVVDFVRAVTYSQQLLFINKEIKEKKIVAQNLVREYEKSQLNIDTSCTGSRNIIKQTELPKRSIQVKLAPQPIKLNIPKFQSSATIQPKRDAKSTINETNLLNEFKQRSLKRQKIIQKRNAFLGVPQRQRKSSQEIPSNEINSTCNNATTNINAKANLTQSNLAKTKPVIAPPKVTILQNEVVSTHESLPFKEEVAEKRPTSGELNTDTKAKKTKRVSFGKYLSQEDQVLKPILNNSEHKTGETSSYFTKTNSANTASQFESAFLNTAERYMPSQEFSMQGDTSDVMGDFMDSKGVVYSQQQVNVYRYTPCPKLLYYHQLITTHTRKAP